MALTAPGKHTCHLPNCDVETPRQFLFCKRHWFLVSRETRIRVWRAYREAGGSDGCIQRATKEWVEAVNLAEKEVLEKEAQRDTRGPFR